MENAEDQQFSQEPKKKAISRIKNLGAITVIRPIQSNACELKSINAKDEQVINSIKEKNLYDLRYNNPPRILGGGDKPDLSVHPLVEKINKQKIESRKKHLQMDTFTRIPELMISGSKNIERPLTTEELRQQRLKHFTKN